MGLRLQIVGGGKMGEALLAGLLRSGWDAADVAVVEQVAPRREQLAPTFPGVRLLDGPEAADGVILAVKPGDVSRACAAIGRAGADRLLSIAAGVTIAQLEASLATDADIHVVRAMPNTPALVGEGASAISPGTNATDDDLAWAESILGAVGLVVRVPEKLLDAVTGLSGSGPAYVFLVAEAMIEAGVLVGLPRETATSLAIQTLLGSARLLAETGDSPEALRAAVTSPGGTTAAGLSALEHAGVRAAMLDAVAAATERAHQLGGS
jgi:pyrroline-5-carboxylate reductase